MASPQPPPGPRDNENNDGSNSKSNADAAPAQPVVDVLGGDAYAAVLVCALVIMGMTQGTAGQLSCAVK